MKNAGRSESTRVCLFTLLSLAADVLSEEIKAPCAPPGSLIVFLPEMFSQVPVV